MAAENTVKKAAANAAKIVKKVGAKTKAQKDAAKAMRKEAKRAEAERKRAEAAQQG